MTGTDNVNHPSHYAEGWSNGSEVIDITENLNFNRGNAVKYIARAGKKDSSKELEDLQKAQWYLSRELTRLAEFHSVDDPEVVEEALAEWERELLGLPRTWSRLRDVPKDAKVTDRDGDIYGYLTTGDGEQDWHYGRTGPVDRCHIEDEVDQGFWDSYAPFTEVPKPTPRVWDLIEDIPPVTKTVDSRGDLLFTNDSGQVRFYDNNPENLWWSVESCAYENEAYGPFTEVLDA